MADTRDNYKPLIVEPRCKVCNSSFRPLVDKMTVEGYRPSAIARMIQDVEPDLSRKSIERHAQRHLSLEQSALKEILERRAEEAKILHDEHRSKIVTRNGLLDAMVERGWNQISDPNAKIQYKDVLSAVELSARIENEAIQELADGAMRQLDAIVVAIKEVVAQDQWLEIVQRAKEIYESPILELPTT